MTGERNDSHGIAALIGIAAVAFSMLYFISDLIELIQGGFSTFQLVLTYAASRRDPLRSWLMPSSGQIDAWPLQFWPHVVASPARRRSHLWITIDDRDALKTNRHGGPPCTQC